MAGNITDLLDRVSDSTTGRPVISSLASPGKAIAAATVNLTDATNWTTSSAIHFSLFSTITVAGITVKDPTTQTDWKGTLAGLVISNLVLTGGTDRTYTAGAIAELTPTARYGKDLYDWGIAHANQDGSLKTSAVQAALNIGTTTPDWTPLGTPPSTVVYNGQRSYTMTFSGVDYTDRIQPGTRLKSQRTVASPTQSTSLDGVSNYWNKTSPTKLSATNNITLDIEFELLAFPASEGTLASLYTSAGGGWTFGINGSGQMFISGLNGGSTNRRSILSYESVTLGKSYRLTAQLDMATWTTTPTTNYMMLNGVEIPVQLTQAGTNPTSFTPTGALEIGSQNGGTLKVNAIIKQFAFFSTKITQATMRTYHGQSYVGNETSLQTAYNFNGNGNDLNTTTPNNLTAQGSATATFPRNAFGIQGSGSVSSTLDYLIVSASTYTSGNTVVVAQTSENSTVPTSGGVTAMSYSGLKVPFGFPAQTGRWRIETAFVGTNNSIPTNGAWYQPQGIVLTVPIGLYDVGYNVIVRGQSSSGATFIAALSTLSTTTTTETDIEFTSIASIDASSASLTTVGNNLKSKQLTLSTATPYYLLAKTNTNGVMGGSNGFNSAGINKVTADNALL